MDFSGMSVDQLRALAADPTATPDVLASLVQFNPELAMIARANPSWVELGAPMAPPAQVFPAPPAPGPQGNFTGAIPYPGNSQFGMVPPPPPPATPLPRFIQGLVGSWPMLLMVAGITYAVGLASSLVVLIVSSIGNSSTSVSASGGLVKPTDAVGYLTGMIHMVAQASLGTTWISGKVLGYHTSGGYFAVPLLITAFLVAGAWVVAAKFGPKGLTLLDRVGWAAIAGFIFAVVSTALAAIPATFSDTGFEFSMAAASPSGFFGGLALVGIATFAGLTGVSLRQIRKAWFVDALVGLGFVVVGSLIGSIVILISQLISGDFVLSHVLAYGGQDGFYGLTIAMGSQAPLGGSATSLFSGAPAWAWITPIFVLALTVAGGVVIAWLHPVKDQLIWARVPVTWLGVGLLAQLVTLTAAGSSGDWKYEGAAAASFLLFAVLGAIAAVSAEFLAPYVVPHLPSLPAASQPSGKTMAAFAPNPGAQGFPGMQAPGAPTYPGAPGMVAPGYPAAPDMGAPGYPAAPAQGYPDASAAFAAPPAPDASQAQGWPDTTAIPAAPYPSAMATGAVPTGAIPTGPYPGGPGAPGAPAPVGKPLSPGAKKGMIIGGVALAVIALAAVGITVVRTMMFSPQATVNSVMAAMEQGRAADAAKGMGLSADNNKMLTDEVYKKTDDRPKSAKITNTSVTGDTATVSVSYEMGGASKDATVTLKKVSTDWLIMDRWQIEDAGLAATARLSWTAEMGSRVVVANGVELGEFKSGSDLVALPGSYTVSLKGNDLLMEESTSWKAAAGDDTLDFDTRPTEKLAQAVATAVGEQMSACANKTTTTNCPYYFTSSYYSNFRIISQPTIRVSAGSSGIVFYTITPGSMSCTETWFGTSSPTTKSLYPMGTAKVENGKVVIVKMS